MASARLAEAKSLLRAGLSDGAYYLAGYSVECGLNVYREAYRRYDFPDNDSVNASYTHKLKELVRVANLEPLRVEQARTDPAFRDYWDLVKQWSEESRYRRHDKTGAKALVEAVGDARHGVLRWIKQHW